MDELKKHWLKHHDYDETLHSTDVYDNYILSIINKGHHLVQKLCYEKFNEKGELSILDIGCGDTDLYKYFDNIVSKYIGVEPIKREILKTIENPKINLIRGTAEKLPLQNNCIDISLHIATLDHCYDAEQAIAEMLRVLVPGGYAIILLESKSRFSNDIRKLLNLEISHGDHHTYYFSVDEIRSLVAPYGEVSFFKSYGYLLGGSFIAKLLPRGILRVFSEILDRTLGFFLPNKGQHFIYCIKKKGDYKDNNSTFDLLCPYCNEKIAWGESSCISCNIELSWLRNDILDILSED